ncbi:hypothetical protein [Streptomyces sp. GbtcB6]|uniref:hypothetical protein n=1 Tax=Streptomyces sp. GbtcB6 TaxID=2824751 RepID=UPI001C2FF6A7|nr:hypothetical protein [Streptomyces sp. GbtcB6]
MGRFHERLRSGVKLDQRIAGSGRRALNLAVVVFVQTAAPWATQWAQTAVDPVGGADAAAAEHVEVGELERGDSGDVLVQDVVLASR